MINRGFESREWSTRAAMAKIDPSVYPLLAEAVAIWTGWGTAAFPRREDGLLVDRFGIDIGARIIPLIKSLEEEFNSSDAWKAGDLQEVAKIAEEDFKSKYPDLPDTIVQAFSWCYTWDWK